MEVPPERTELLPLFTRLLTPVPVELPLFGETGLAPEPIELPLFGETGLAPEPIELPRLGAGPAPEPILLPPACDGLVPEPIFMLGLLCLFEYLVLTELPPAAPELCDGAAPLPMVLPPEEGLRTVEPADPYAPPPTAGRVTEPGLRLFEPVPGTLSLRPGLCVKRRSPK